MMILWCLEAIQFLLTYFFWMVAFCTTYWFDFFPNSIPWRYIYCIYSIVRKKNCKPGYFGALGSRCVASILVDGLSVLHLNWWNTRRYGLFGDWFKIKIRSTWEIRKCPELEMAVGCILARELMTTRRFKTGEDDASSFCTQGERREELIYSNFHVIL